MSLVNPKEEIAEAINKAINKALLFDYEQVTPILKYVGAETGIFRAMVYFEPDQITFSLHNTHNNSDLGVVVYDRSLEFVSNKTEHPVFRQETDSLVQSLKLLQSVGNINLSAI